MPGLYAIVLTFPPKISGEIDKYRSEFHRYVRYTIEPHLTLIQPFSIRSEISVISSHLQKIAERTSPFTLVLDGVAFFEGRNNAAYLSIMNKKPVAALHMDIIKSLEDAIDEGSNGRFHRENYIPHVTYGEQIPDEVLPDVKKELAGFHPHYECEITGFSLFSAGEDENWKQERFFEFSE